MSRVGITQRLLGSSLALRFIAMTVIGQTLFGAVLGLGAGGYVALSDFQLRQDYMDNVASAVSASLLPLVMDRDVEAAQIQLDSVRMLPDNTDLIGLRFLDGSGRVIAESFDTENPLNESDVSTGLRGRFLGPTYIESDVAVGGVRLGSLGLMFRERSYQEVFGTALLISLLVTTSVVLVSAAWFSWLAVRTIIEPVQSAQRAAEELAAGKRDIEVGYTRKDELGKLGKSLEDLSRQLFENEEHLRRAAVQSEQAYAIEARAREEVEQLDRLKSDFVAVAAHEFATPLSIITLYTDLLAAGDVCELSGDAAEMAEHLKSAAYRMNSSLSDLMDVALLERGLMKVSFRVFDLSTVVLQAGRGVAVLAESRGIMVDVENVEEGYRVLGDSVRIRQIMDNLLSNAIKYSDSGGCVFIACYADENSVVAEVTDSGPGIPPDRQEHVFKMFGRLDTADNRETAGLGLGLAISARIADAHKATIDFRENPTGTGTVFTFRMPLALDVDEADLRTIEVPVVGLEGGGAT